MRCQSSSPTSNGTRIWRWKTTIRRRIPGWLFFTRMSTLWWSTSLAACCPCRAGDEHKDSVMARVQRDFPQSRIGAPAGYGDQRRDCGGLTKAAERELKRQFREREPKKQYVARVWGHPEKSGRSGGFTADLRLAEPAKAEGVLQKPAKRRKPSMKCWSSRRTTPPACA